ncbi:type 1 glutamine amidotransferase domain-containing protein [Burkholderia sp. WAC0059]|uniref:type 1 glutamine amidotransferase domain-containing protein n=1 Tax=Burkholderia sp. WAC0059 TaxID=2066022 RepID=UPI000C7F55EC|nr:type 1 glutamine amidotransferase domain-containing protein [Burkholderia sp. WAC0059]PLZ00956.1 type 1 glutamine amidotransferase domain-containing protein [Burkholderia sp. WAC0059]
MKILMVLSSCDQVPGSDRKTGSWLDEVAGPYYTFIEAGAEVVLASVQGGLAPVDPASEADFAQTDATRRFSADPLAQHALANTAVLSTLQWSDYDAVFYSGGLGPVFDLTSDQTSIDLIERMSAAQRPVAAVCHGVAVLRGTVRADGRPLIDGRAVTGFSNSEEVAAHGTGVVPFVIEDEMRRLGGIYTSATDWNPHVVVDDRLITGQNPASSVPAAQRVLEMLR